MSRRAADLEEIVSHAVEIESPLERAAYLNEACGGDPAVRAQVENLLGAHGNARDVLEAPTISAFPDDDRYEPVDEPGPIVGPYKLLHVIGAGGMGVVYMAEQTEPVRRRVALKIIRPGMDSRQVTARFEAERQALALMEHPNIAKVFDAGTTDRGRPYFVMELVKGTPITKYCDDVGLTPRERLELFVPVCHAIQHAHQRGIIHRDVKPSNVLVALFDGKPVPKVIDFGVAKAIDQRLTERTLFTRHGTIVGTLAYMSPEQAENSSLDVDTRTDVYSLGALLYELLTGTTPLDELASSKGGLFESLRRIREEEPPRLSSRLSRTKELAAIAARRRMEPAKLARLMRGELDWIVLKALDRDRNRRYETPGALARDIDRYLANEPVEAVPPSVVYQARKYAGKHRTPLITLAAFAAVLVAATVVSAWQAIRARREETNARQSDAESKAVLKFFRENVLAAARPQGRDGGLGYDVRLHEAIDQAEPKIAGNFAGQPRIEAAVRDSLGSTYFYLGRWPDAIGQLERALALRSKVLGPEHLDTLSSMNDLAVAYRSAGRAADAVTLHQQALKSCEATLGREHPETLKRMDNLGVALRFAGRPAEAIPFLKDVLAIRTAKFGLDNPETLTTMHNLAVAYRTVGRLGEAVLLHEQDLEHTRALLGADHLDTFSAMDTLAAAYLDAGRVDDAIRLFEESLALRVARLGADHPETLGSRNNLAAAYLVAGRPAEAVQMFEEVVALRSRTLKPDHPDTLASKTNLALAHLDAGRIELAQKLLFDVLQLRIATLPADHPDTLKSMNDLASAYLEAKRWADAEALLRGCLARREQQRAGGWRLYLTMSQLGAALGAQKKFAAAEPLLVEGHDGMTRHQTEIPAHRKKELTAAAWRLAALYAACGKPAEAAEWEKRVQAGQGR